MDKRKNDEAPTLWQRFTHWMLDDLEPLDRIIGLFLVGIALLIIWLFAFIIANDCNSECVYNRRLTNVEDCVTRQFLTKEECILLQLGAEDN